MGEDRNARFGLHAADQAFAAAGNEHVDSAVEAGKHHAYGLSLARRHQRNRCRRQASFYEACGQRRMDRPRRAEAFGTAAQDDGIARLQAQRPGICRDIRPALINHADHAKRYAHAFDAHAVRPPP
jgi:hypothetical protein